MCPPPGGGSRKFAATPQHPMQRMGFAVAAASPRYPQRSRGTDATPTPGQGGDVTAAVPIDVQVSRLNAS